jgi:alkylation response protein AidB-like acyl-CoA dehydrogenase
MTTLHDSPTTAPDVLGATRALLPTITARAAEIEASRRIPTDLLGALTQAGCFRMLLPKSHGGVGADLTTALGGVEMLARADGSTGWTVMIGAGSWIDLAGLPRASFDALYADGPDTIMAGAFNPTGAIERDGDGYRVSGRWSFASGCEHATWIWGNCFEGVVDGVPQLRVAVFPAEEVEIEDTWNVSGLRGTGSHHFHVRDAFVPAERTTRPMGDEPCIPDAIVRVPAPSLFALAISAVALGIAQGALDEIATLAQEKTPLLAGDTLAGDPLFQTGLATADAELRAVRALLYATTDEAWRSAAAGDEFTLQTRAEIRAGAVLATQRATTAVDFAYHSGGGSALYADSPLQRRLRDIHAVTQHFLVKQSTLTTAGAILAGRELTVPVF